jgi:hypothetical protein
VIRLVLIAALACAPAACKSKSSSDSKDESQAEVESSAGQERPAEPAQAEVAITRDGNKIAVAPPTAFTNRWPLAKVGKLPPVEKWKLVTANGADGKQLFISDVTEKHPGHEIRFYRDSQGRPSIGLFRNPAAGEPAPDPSSAIAAPVVHLRNVQSIDVKTQLPKPQVAPVRITVEQKGAEPIVIDETAFQDAEQVLPPDGEQTRGWSLAALLAPHLGDGKAPALVVSGGGKSVEIPKGALTADDQLLFLKINRRGELRFRWYVTKPKVDVKGELRGLSKVEVR